MSLVSPCKAIVPQESELQVETNVPCTVEGCEKTFKSSSSLRMHISRHHEGAGLSSVAPGNRDIKTLYYCPVVGCNRSLVGKPFPRMGQLKQVR